MTHSTINRKTFTYIVIVVITGISIFFTQVNFSIAISEWDWFLFATLVLGIILSNQFYIPIFPSESYLSMDTAFFMAVLFVFGIEKVLLVLLVSNIFFALVGRKIQWWKHVFNFAIYSIMLFGTYYTFLLIGGDFVSLNRVTNLIPYSFALLSYFIVNITLIVTFIYFSTAERLGLLLKNFAKEAFSNYFITLAASYILVVLLKGEYPIIGLFVFTFIICLLSLVFQKNFQLYENILKEKVYREQILNSLPVGVITIDDKTSNVALNQAAIKLLDTNKNQVNDVINEKTEILQNEPFWSSILSNQKYKNKKVPYSVDDKNHLLLMTQSELINQYEQSVGRIIHFVDINEAVELERRINQSEKLAVLGELAAGAAHEIRNPLTVIQGFLTLLNEELEEKEKQKYNIPLLLKEFKRIDSIVEEMLLIAKPGVPKCRTVFIEDLVTEIIPFYDNQQVAFDIKLFRVPLQLDAKQITQVLHNLFRNSIEAIGGKGTISLYSEVKNDWYFLYIKDSGPGISTELKARLFEPFLTTKDSGTGLGLPIVQRIISNHNGKIELLNNEETTFLISFPVQTDK